jgi:rod shape-determining protein MreD
LTNGSRIGLAIVVALLVALHFTVRPVLDWRTGIDFLLVAVLLVVVRLRPGVAAWLGLAVGLAADALSPAAFGAGALAMTLVAFAASWLKAYLFADDTAVALAFFASGKWAFDVVYVLAERRLGGAGLLLQVFAWSPIAAVATALTGVVVVVVARPLLGRVDR